MVVIKNYDDLRSGWKIIMNIINVSLNEQNKRIQEVCFNIVHSVMENGEKLENVFDVLVELI